MTRPGSFGFAAGGRGGFCMPARRVSSLNFVQVAVWVRHGWSPFHSKAREARSVLAKNGRAFFMPGCRSPGRKFWYPIISLISY